MTFLLTVSITSSLVRSTIFENGNAQLATMCSITTFPQISSFSVPRSTREATAPMSAELFVVTGTLASTLLFAGLSSCPVYPEVIAPSRFLVWNMSEKVSSCSVAAMGLRVRTLIFTSRSRDLK